MDFIIDTVLIGIVGGMFLLSSVVGIIFIIEIVSRVWLRVKEIVLIDIILIFLVILSYYLFKMK